MISASLLANWCSAVGCPSHLLQYRKDDKQEAQNVTKRRRARPSLRHLPVDPGVASSDSGVMNDNPGLLTSFAYFDLNFDIKILPLIASSPSVNLNGHRGTIPSSLFPLSSTISSSGTVFMITTEEVFFIGLCVETVLCA